MKKHFYTKKVRAIVLAGMVIWPAFARADARQHTKKPEVLADYLKKVEKTYSVSFVYDAARISKTRSIQVSPEIRSIEESLAQLDENDIAYKKVGNQVILKAKPASAVQQTITVTGVVRDSGDGSVMPGVSVVEKGTNNTISTSAAGAYRITVKEGATLIFRYIGYTSKELPVNGRSQLNVTLAVNSNQLQDVNVVSTGYQQLDRKLFTGSATQVKAADAQRNGVPDISRMLEGQVAGVSVQNVSGTFGAAPKIRVRGATSLSGDNKPLWVVDGIILEDVVNISNEALSTGDANTLIGSSVAGLNPDDIESFTILKDAAATAQYGARAMNGVIVVNTKKGRVTDGAPLINYTGNFTTYLKPTYSQFDILNSADQMSVLMELESKGYFNHAGASRGSDGGIFYKMYNKMYDYDATSNTFALRNDIQSRNKFLERYANANTDWFDLLFQNSLLQEHSLSISSGTQKFRTYASTSFLNDNGQTLGNNVNRFTGNFRLNFEPSKKFTGELLINGSIRDQRAPGTLERNSDPVYGTFSRDFDINPYSYALNTARTLTAFDEQGNREFFVRNFVPFNILNELENNYLKLGQIDLKIQGGIKYKIIPSLTYSVDGAYRFAKTERQHYIREGSNMVMAYQYPFDATTIGQTKYLYTDPEDPTAYPVSVLPEGGFYNTTTDNLTNYYFRQNLEYDATINKDHRMNFFGSMEVRYVDRQNENFDGVGYQYENGGIVNPAYKYFKWGQESGFPYFGMQFGYDRFTAFALRGAYSYKDKYSFNATTRYDGSNLMGKSNTARWLPTWNVSGAWNVDQEEFWPENKILTSARVRGTYGLVANLGNANNSAATFYNQVSRRPYENEKETVTYINSLENSELTWEKLKELNIGADLGFFKDRVNLTVDLYRRNIFDLIGSIRTSGIGGQYTKVANYGAMRGEGMELTLGGTPVLKKDLKWRTNLNFAFNKNKITSLEVNPSIFSLVDADGGALLGYAQRGLFSVNYAGLDPNYGFPIFVDERGRNNTYVNLQSDRVGSLKYEGPVDPIFTGGFYNQVSYKNFTLSALFTFAAGNYVRLANTYSASYPDIYAMSKDMLNRWVQPGDEQFTRVPALLDAFTAAQVIRNADGGSIGAVYPYNLYNFSSERVAKGDFVRFKQISLGYNLPQKFLSVLNMKSASLTLVGNNIWLIYSDKRLNGQDPEFFGSGGVAMPIPKQYTLSLKVGF